MMERGQTRRGRSRPQVLQGETEELAGSVESVVYRSEESGYTVMRVPIPGRSEPAVVVGVCSTVWVGETIRARGRWTRHERHGLQFQADEIVCVAPTSTRGIERYLASGMIHGIGKITAERLVRHFGEQTLEIIEKESKRLEEVEGIGPTRRKQIKDSWSEHRGVRDIMIFLQGHGIGTAQSARIFRTYGSQAVALIRENPYRLCRDVWGVGFKTADRVAMSLGIAPDAPVRAQAGLLYVLQTMTEEGHCYCPEAELMLASEALLSISVEILGEALKTEVAAGRLVRDGDRIFPASLYNAELLVSERVKTIQATPASFRPIVVEKAVPWAEQRVGISLAPRQADALAMAMGSKLSVITGGPGVGKTTIIRALVEVFAQRELQVMLAAPTGRAAKRMEEATGHPAATLHRLLKYQPQTRAFDHHAGNPLPGDVFIVDEASMIDIHLMAAFLQAVPVAACVVFVGDVDQLPSVGPGNVLRDLIHSGVVPCTALDFIFRQQSGGWIVRNAHRVNRGEPLELPEDDQLSDFYFIHTEEPDLVIARMLHLVTNRIPKRFGFNPMTDIQVLTPMRRNQLGAENLNTVLQQALNPEGPSLERFGRTYRTGDRVMQIRNNYDKNVFNGDVGRIAAVDVEALTLTVDYDGRRVGYDQAEIDELMHAYACSIHKSQGSEYPAVVILMTTQHFKLLQRNLLYTAITRGRRLVCLVGTHKAVSMAIRNNEIRQRRTSLRDRLRGAAGQE